MKPFTLDIEQYSEPNGEEYLWRYIKPQYVDSFLNGDIYFAMLNQFNDNFEAIDPVHYFIYHFLNYGIGKQFDFSKRITEIETSEELRDRLLMSISIYDLEKKISRITGITKKSELEELIKFHIKNINDLAQSQFDFQYKHYASCWFVGDHIESALMWSSYSEPNGIAVRIKYKDFKKITETYFKETQEKIFGIEKCYAGLITYCDYNDPNDWLAKIENGGNLIFFKQQFYKDEREYRFVLKRYDGLPREMFNQKHQIFKDISKFDVLLHPASLPDEITRIQAKLPGSLKCRVSMSEMSLTNKNI